MSNDKPLRHEEYLAMAEENRRLKAENERLRDEPRRKARRRQAMKVSFAVAGALVTLAIMVFGVVYLSTRPSPSKETKTDPPRRTTPCYFVRHKLYEDEDKAASPWDKWFVFKSDSEGGENHHVYRDGDYVSFDRKQDAWQFIKAWNLEACK